MQIQCTSEDFCGPNREFKPSPAADILYVYNEYMNTMRFINNDINKCDLIITMTIAIDYRISSLENKGTVII